LGEELSTNTSIKAIIGIGEEWKRLKLQITNDKLRLVEGCKNMEEIVASAHALAEPGDVVVLSPACASFGMFKNYKDRGEQFQRGVEKIIK
jgi:UDP-N-acetylmuramoylalanine--D-glutamate ligase